MCIRYLRIIYWLMVSFHLIHCFELSYNGTMTLDFEYRFSDFFVFVGNDVIQWIASQSDP